MDYDNDGDLDILSGSYTGEIYYFECSGGQNYLQGRRLKNEDGEDLKSKSYSITVEAWDFDQDGDLDLILGTRTSAVEIVENIGTRKNPAYRKGTRPLKTKEGTKIKGSNAHFADWDGDGSRDLVLGSEYGGVHWYRNLGSTEDPQFGERENLIEALEFKRRDEKDGPEGAGSRSKVFVTDYNGDGLTDLLVGDVQWLHYTLPPLTADQEARKAEILPDYEKAASELDAAYDERNALVGKDGGIPEAVEKRIDRALEKWRPLAKIMEEFDREKSNTHGWVWLYLQAKS